MSKAVNFILGAVLIILGINSFWDFLGGTDYMTFIVGAIGIIIMLTPITRPRAKGEKMNSFYYLVKRWVFGAVLVVCGLGSWIPYIRDYASGILYGTSVAAGLIIIFMGIIYFFSAFKRMRKVQFVSS